MVEGAVEGGVETEVIEAAVIVAVVIAAVAIEAVAIEAVAIEAVAIAAVAVVIAAVVILKGEQPSVGLRLEFSSSSFSPFMVLLLSRSSSFERHKQKSRDEGRGGRDGRDGRDNRERNERPAPPAAKNDGGPPIKQENTEAAPGNGGGEW
jgi:hypothetical protein